MSLAAMYRVIVIEVDTVVIELPSKTARAAEFARRFIKAADPSLIVVIETPEQIAARARRCP